MSRARLLYGLAFADLVLAGLLAAADATVPAFALAFSAAFWFWVATNAVRRNP